MTIRSEMGILEFGRPRDAWGGEASDFTPLLADRLSYLGEVTELGPLELIDTESLVAGSRRIDVLAALDDRPIVIENQYGAADHDHLTRGLAYAVAEGAAALVVVAESHRPEFVAVADYLNELVGADGEPGVQVWLVEVQAVRRRGDEIWSPLFSVQARPNQWEVGVRAAQQKRRSHTWHGVTSVAEFLEACERPDAARILIEAWEGFPASRIAIGSGKTPTVQLLHPDPASPRRGHAVMTVRDGGHGWVNYRFIRDSTGAFDEGNRRTRDSSQARLPRSGSSLSG